MSPKDVTVLSPLNSTQQPDASSAYVQPVISTQQQDGSNAHAQHLPGGSDNLSPSEYVKILTPEVNS